MDNKIITDDILQKAIQDTIQIIADNIFEFESYSDESIAELFSLTPEEAQNLTELINDEVISKYKLWSSKKVSDELLNAQNECNDYTDDRLSGISSISLKYCEELPDVAESNCIYILKSTDSNPDTLNLYDSDNTTWISIGDFNISLDDVYKKSEVDTKLDLKADKTEILAQDDVLIDTSLATTTNVLSATTTIEELDKKVDKDNLVTTYSANVTDEQVFSAKVVHSEFSKGFNGILTQSMTSVTDMDNLTRLGQHEVVWDTTNISNFPPVSKGTTRMRIKIEGISTSMYRQEIEFHAGVVNQGIWYRNLIDGVWSTWKKITTSTVEDVDKVIITTQNLTAGIVSYFVKNGICYVSISGITPSLNGGSTIITANTLPLPDTKGNNHYTIGTTSGVVGLFVINNDGSAMFYGQNTVSYFGQFSYPVAES